MSLVVENQDNLEIISELDNSIWLITKTVKMQRKIMCMRKLAMCRGQGEACKQEPKDHSEAVVEPRGWLIFFSSTASSSYPALIELLLATQY